MRTFVRMTHPASEVREALRLARVGLSASAIARRTGGPRETVRDWLADRVPGASRAWATCPRCELVHTQVLTTPTAYAYLLGLYLGDGCVSTHPRGVHKLRISLDAAYPGIVGEAAAAIEAALERVSVGCLSLGTWVELYAYSKAWPCVFPQHGPGKKHLRRIVLEPWQTDLVEQRPDRLLRGLIHSDGCRFMNTGRNWRHPRYCFDNLSSDIRTIFCQACDLLNIGWTTSRNRIYVSRKADVARMDAFIGPKR
jgi:hypothetical protein